MSNPVHRIVDNDISINVNKNVYMNVDSVSVVRARVFREIVWNSVKANKGDIIREHLLMTKKVTSKQLKDAWINL